MVIGFFNFSLFIVLFLTFTSCRSSSTSYNPPLDPTPICSEIISPDIDPGCVIMYYSSGETIELDIQAQAADLEEAITQSLSTRYQENFGLSLEDASKIAQTVTDFSTLQERSNEDLADFAEKLYGINPTNIISAVSKAQVGDHQELDHLISDKSHDFEISESQMKGLIQDLHGQVLMENGISF